MKNLNFFVLILLLLPALVLPAAVPPMQPVPHSAAGGQKELKKILARSAQYSRRLLTSAFDYLCRESVEETITTRQYFKPYKLEEHSMRQHQASNSSVYEYRLVRQDEQVSEDRKPIAKNGKSLNNGKQRRPTTLQSYKSSLAPFYLFAAENQNNYSYRLLGKETVMKRPAHVVEVRSKQRGKEHKPFVTAWIDTKDFSILKFRAYPESIKGYRQFISNRERDVRDLQVEDVHYFGEQSQGLRFPSRTEITFRYTYDFPLREGLAMPLTAGARMMKKIKTVFRYQKYMFYKIEVSQPQYLEE